MSQTPEQWFFAACASPEFICCEGDEIHPCRADARFWFRACRLQAGAESPLLPHWHPRAFANLFEKHLPTDLDWLDLARVAILHVEVARAMLPGGHPLAGLAAAEALKKLASSTEPLPLLLDLQSELHRDAPEPGLRHGICAGAVRDALPSSLDLPPLLVAKEDRAGAAASTASAGRP